MQLNESEIVLVPKGNESLLLVIGKGHKVPRGREIFLLKTAEMFSRLVQEASPAEIEDANNRIRDNLPDEEQTWLPPGLLDDPKTPRALMMNPASEGSNLHEWKTAVRDALAEGDLELMPQPEARELAKELNLEVFLSRFL